MRRLGVLLAMCLVLGACGSNGEEVAAPDSPPAAAEEVDLPLAPESPAPAEPAAPEPEVAPDPPPDATADDTESDAGTLWFAGMEDGTLDEWASGEGGHLANSGDYEAVASTEQARSGSHSLRARIWTPNDPASGVRAFRWQEAVEHRELSFSAWFYIPRSYAQIGSAGAFWNVFQFKSSPDDERTDPLWVFDLIETDGELRVRAAWGVGGTTVSGPFEGDDVSEKYFSNSSSEAFPYPGEPPRTAPVPIGEWFELRAFLRQSKDFDGRLTFWLDSEMLFDFENVRTSYDYATAGQSWGANNDWSVNNYSDGLDPSPSTLYIDDARISLP